MPHAIVEIDELLRLVIDELVATSPPTAVSLAITCRSLEEPTLSSLWRQQTSLDHLLKVLPGSTWAKKEYGLSVIVSVRSLSACRTRYQFPQAIEHDPSAKDWARLQRYASWMRKLSLGRNDRHIGNTLSRLHSNSPGGLLFPKLEYLDWNVQRTDATLTFFPLFLSPHLQRIDFYTNFLLQDTPQDQLTALVQIISGFPTSLEYLTLTYARGNGEPLKDAVSSFICRCGPLLRGLRIHVPLSEAAFHHLMQLPNLSHWSTVQGPLQVVPTSAFPSLEHIGLREPEALPWLHLLASHERDIPRNGSASEAPRTNIREMLHSLSCPSGTIVDSTLLSSIVKFRNLATLRVNFTCPWAKSCIFRLTDGDMENLAAALPRLECLNL